jgi:hypothetical protein
MKVTKLDGDSYTVNLIPAAVIAAEDHFSKGFAKMFDEGTLKALFWSAWKATQYSGRVVEPYEEWILGISNVEIVDEGAALPLEGR